MKTQERRQWRRSGIFIVYFGHISLSSVSIIDFEQEKVSCESALIIVLVKRWKKNCSFIGDLKITVAFDTFCLSLQCYDVSMELDELSTNHKETNMRMMLRTKHISQRFNLNTVIHTIFLHISYYIIQIKYQHIYPYWYAKQITDHICFQIAKYKVY